MSLILANLIDERLAKVEPAMVISTLVQLAVLLKVMAIEGEIEPPVAAYIDKSLESINILDVVDLYVAHRPEEGPK